jgi:hypothetical protein
MAPGLGSVYFQIDRKRSMARKPPGVSDFMVGGGPRAMPRADVPSGLKQQIEQSLDDLRHDRTEDLGAFLQRMRAKIAAARAARGKKGQSR